MSELIVRELRLRRYRASREAPCPRVPAAPDEAEARTTAAPPTTPAPSPWRRGEHGVVL